MSAESQRSDYLSAAATVRRRLSLVRFAAGLRRTHLGVALLIVAAVLSVRLFAQWREHEWILALGIFLMWLVGLGLAGLFRLPDPGAALLILDRRGGWKDCFSSAWEFLHRPEPSEAEKLHLARAQAQLEKAKAGVPDVLPVAKTGRAWIAPVLAVLFALTPWGRSIPDALDLQLTEEMQAAAALQAEELAREAARLEGMKSLSEEEKKELEALRAQVDGAAEALANPEGLTAGEMLESLEERARAAERLAEKLGQVANEWASPEMLAEMEKHSDTSDLALFIADKAAEGAATEAMALRDVLAGEMLASQIQERLTRALEMINGAATEADRGRPVGERVGNASRKLLDAQAKTAAREFEELAKHFRELSSREEAKKKLEDLAANLREAGGEISGSELKKMEENAPATLAGQPAPEGLQSIDSGAPGTAPGDQPGAGQEMPGGQPETKTLAAPGIAQAGTQDGEKAPVPGAAPGEGESAGDGKGKGKGEQTFSAPVPGEKAPDGQSGSGLGMSDQTKDGKGQDGMLSAPIPGMAPGQPAPGSGLALGKGASNQSGQGGDQAGTGTAPMVDAASELLKAKSDSEVIAAAGKEGESTVRAVEGQARAEQATRSRQEVMADFIAVEEQALDEQSLPLSRRQQVLRYFSALRAQFEKADPE
ncbi:MAG: hypothetical protein JNJ70_13585 [Verrucomicrobiales bacterium]|nr:hypothetical protein [Verrucomicrobiales bacterium]